jgi:hypothetical protein
MTKAQTLVENRQAAEWLQWGAIPTGRDRSSGFGQPVHGCHDQLEWFTVLGS